MDNDGKYITARVMTDDTNFPFGLGTKAHKQELNGSQLLGLDNIEDIFNKSVDRRSVLVYPFSDSRVDVNYDNTNDLYFLRDKQSWRRPGVSGLLGRSVNDFNVGPRTNIGPEIDYYNMRAVTKRYERSIALLSPNKDYAIKILPGQILAVKGNHEAFQVYPVVGSRNVLNSDIYLSPSFSNDGIDFYQYQHIIQHVPIVRSRMVRLEWTEHRRDDMTTNRSATYRPKILSSKKVTGTKYIFIKTKDEELIVVNLSKLSNSNK